MQQDGGLSMLVLLHALIPCFAAYILPRSPVLLHIYCPLPLSCCIYTTLILCLAAYILPSSPVLLHIYCPHPLSCCIYTALIPCLAAYILPSSPVLLHALPLSCCIYTTLIPCLAAYILPSSPVLLHIYSPVLLHVYCTCFSTFWHHHPCIHPETFFKLPLYISVQISCSKTGDEDSKVICNRITNRTRVKTKC